MPIGQKPDEMFNFRMVVAIQKPDRSTSGHKLAIPKLDVLGIRTVTILLVVLPL
jgi:hypothetical protein